MIYDFFFFCAFFDLMMHYGLIGGYDTSFILRAMIEMNENTNFLDCSLFS